MELGLRIGDAGKPSSLCPSDDDTVEKEEGGGGCGDVNDDRQLGISLASAAAWDEERDDDHRQSGSTDPPIQLDLLLHIPVPRKDGSSRRPGSSRDGSSQNSRGSSSFQMDLGITDCRGKKSTTGAVDDEDDQSGIISRSKKLRLSKEQSAFLEESFKEHHTLNPKQKLALAKQLNLRPRQVEVWFQNRRARTKLKQMEVDCDYLKKCCEVLTEENRRLQKELQELRALKSTAGSPFCMQLPATTLTMCPSCERVSSASAAASSITAATRAGDPPPISKAAAAGLFFLHRHRDENK